LEEIAMNLMMRNLSLVFVAGCWGALWNSLTFWLFGILGIPATLGIHSSPPALTAAFLYPRLVWGGLWGCLFLAPLGRWSFPARGLIFSLAPTLVQLFLVFPVMAHKGVLGLQLGGLTPFLVVFYNAIWGYGAGWWLNWVAEKNRTGQIG
jgi:hypothetical protein